MKAKNVILTVYLSILDVVISDITQQKYFGDIFKIFYHIPFDTSKFVDNTDNGEYTVQINDINYYLSSRNNQNYVMMNDEFDLINPKWKVKVLVHGWTEHNDVEWCKNATAAYLRKGNYNVVSTDWSKIGDNNYLIASMLTREVGDRIGDWIVKLHENRGIPYKNFHLLSHSLGCQVAGFIGKRVFAVTGNKVGRITALDAAAPIFDLFGPDRRLDKEDAKFVDIYHTDGGVLGFKYPIGDADFFLNGGSALQPGCSLLKPDVKYEDLFCSHARSHRFFIETINAPKGHARSCSSWEEFLKDGCAPNKSIVYGEWASSKLSGNFFLKTDPEGNSLE